MKFPNDAIKLKCAKFRADEEKADWKVVSKLHILDEFMKSEKNIQQDLLKTSASCTDFNNRDANTK